MRQLPEKVSWDLAVAQRWLENMKVERTRLSSSQSSFSFEMCSKNRQKDALRTFAQKLKWPNMEEVLYVLEEQDEREPAVEDRSYDSMSWLSGCVLPGRTLPWLLMNTLIDCDRDTAGALKYLSHMQPSAGFQYRANTYWSYLCIVGKVLGASRGVSEFFSFLSFSLPFFPTNSSKILARSKPS